MRRILIVDGYNVIGARAPVRESLVLEDARKELTERLHDYAGSTGQQVILVYDAWLSDRALRSEETRGPLKIVFTMKGETADRYIERLCDRYSDDISYRRAEVRVATGDRLEQTIAFGRGAIRLSSAELLNEMDRVRAERAAGSGIKRTGTTIQERVSEEIRQRLEAMRRGEA